MAAKNYVIFATITWESDSDNIKSSIESAYRFGQSSGKREVVITASVISLYLPVSKENQLKTQTNITYLLGQC